MRITDESIKNTLREFANRGNKEYKYFFCTDTYSKWWWLINPAFAMTNYIVGVDEKEIVFVKLNKLNNSPKSYKVKKINEIKNFKIKNFMFGLGKKIIIKFEDNKTMKLNVNKLVKPVHNQKENLFSAIEILESYSF